VSRPSRDSGPAAGFSVLELAIVVGVLGLMLGGITMILQTSSDAFASGSARMKLEGQGNRTMGSIVDILRSAQGMTLAPVVSAPASSPQVDFCVSLGAQPGGVVLGNTQRLRLAQGRIELVQDLGLPSEHSTVICRDVPDLLEGELVNNLDDNGNGLVDETGLCFTFEGSVLRVLLTLGAAGPRGTTMTRTFEGRLFCRN